MPPKKSSDATATASLTDRDHQAIVAAFKHNKNAFELDFEGYAATLGLANAASGRTNWSNLKKKLGVSGDAAAASKKRKVDEDKAADEGEEDEVDDGEAVEEAPKKKQATKKGKNAVAVKDGVDDAEEELYDDEVEEAPKKKKAVKATKAAKKGKKAVAVKDEDGEDF